MIYPNYFKEKVISIYPEFYELHQLIKDGEIWPVGKILKAYADKAVDKLVKAVMFNGSKEELYRRAVRVEKTKAIYEEWKRGTDIKMGNLKGTR